MTHLQQENAPDAHRMVDNLANRPWLREGGVDPSRANQIKAAKRAAWAPVRQPSASLARFHRAILQHYGLRIGSAEEPTTVRRLRQLLRRAGVLGHQAEQAVGCKLERYLELNPGWPLWHMVAAVLETHDLAVADGVLAGLSASNGAELP
jgi:hypothetical protein